MIDQGVGGGGGGGGAAGGDDGGAALADGFAERPCSHAVSVMTEVAGLPLIVAWANAGNIVGLWLP